MSTDLTTTDPVVSDVVAAATGLTDEQRADLAEYLMRLGDDALVLAQRLCLWVTHAPTLEEELALSNMSLDLIGHAQLLLDLTGALDGTGRGHDVFAFLRTDREFRNALLLELPDADFATAVVRQLFFATYAKLLWHALARGGGAGLSVLATRAAREVEFHRMHATRWTTVLGRGTPESHRRMQAAVETLWPYADELFEDDDLQRRLAGAGGTVAPRSLRPAWLEQVTRALTAAGLRPGAATWRASGGRSGRHTEQLGPILALMQSVHRQHPEGAW